MNGPHKVRATNSFCIPLLSYGFGLIPLTKKEIAEFDVKLLTASCNHNPRSAVEHLYLPQNAGSIGSINVENLFCRRIVTIACLLSASTDSLICKCFKLDELLPLRHSETVSTILAVQDQVIATRMIEAKVMHEFIPSLMCGVCGTAEEKIVHLLAA